MIQIISGIRIILLQVVVVTIINLVKSKVSCKHNYYLAIEEQKLEDKEEKIEDNKDNNNEASENCKQNENPVLLK